KYKYDIHQAVVDGVIDVEGLRNIPAVFRSAPDKKEYKAFQDFFKGISEMRGITVPQAQASLWIGAAKMTGVDEGSLQTVLGVARVQVAKQAADRGISETQVWHELLFKGGMLSLLAFVATGGLEGSPEEQAQETGEFSYGGGPTAGPRDLAAALGPPPGPGGQSTAFSSIQPQLMGA
ncbi:MAG: hypothetical protein U9R22_08995, partial [Pseudomonadota bacterium]|nr:hypothetical protein [Pseudomonadota bacterium]